jgi:glycosyltransferase involved in cell wall biosynthesis
MVEDGVNGLLFEPGDVEDLAAKMIRVSIDAGTRRSLAAEATRTARERFSIERNVSCIENLYASLLGQSVPRSEQAELVER